MLKRFSVATTLALCASLTMYQPVFALQDSVDAVSTHSEFIGGTSSGENRANTPFGARVLFSGELDTSFVKGSNEDAFKSATMSELFWDATDATTANHKLALRATADAGRYGSYSFDDFYAKSKADLRLNVENRLERGMHLGGVIGFKFGPRSYKMSTADTINPEVSNLNAYVSSDFGRVEFGVGNSITSTMRVDAFSSAANDPASVLGVASLEGQAISARIDGAKSYLEVPVRRPFLLLPMLYTDYVASGAVPWMSDINGKNVGENPIRVSYSSPRYSGIALGLSYTPDLGSTIRHYPSKSSSSYSDIFAGALSFTKDFEGLYMKLAATGEAASYSEGSDAASSSSHDLRSWNVGGSVNYFGLAVSASIGSNGMAGTGKTYPKHYLSSSLVTKDNAGLAADATDGEFVLKTQDQIVKARNALKADTKANPDDATYWTFGVAYEAYQGKVSFAHYKTVTKPFDKAIEKDNVLTATSIAAHYNVASLSSIPGSSSIKMLPYAVVNIFNTKEGNPVATESDSDNSGFVWMIGTKVVF